MFDRLSSAIPAPTTPCETSAQMSWPQNRFTMARDVPVVVAGVFRKQTAGQCRLADLAWTGHKDHFRSQIFQNGGDQSPRSAFIYGCVG